MKGIFVRVTIIAFISIFFMAQSLSAQEGVTIIDLGALGGSCVPGDVNEMGQVVGKCFPPDGSSYNGFSWTEEYGMEDIGTLGGNSTFVRAVNDLGQAVGWSQTESGRSRAFLWTREGGMVNLGDLGGIDSYAFNINNLGQVVGYIYNYFPTGNSPAFMWTEQGGLTILGTLGDLATSPSAINDLGQVVGQQYNSSGETHGFFWSEGTGIIDIGTLGGTLSLAYDINDRGQVVGYSTIDTGEAHAFLWTADSGMIDLGTLPETDTCFAIAINDSGQVVGNCYDSSAPSIVRAFSWTAEAGMTDLGTFGGIAGANDVNNFGQVVGVSSTPSIEPHAFLWTAKEGMVDLGAPSGGDYYSSASKINDSGYVIGTSRSPDEEISHATLWIVPLPALTPEEQINIIVDQVGELVTEGVLNQGESVSLIAKLDGATKLFNDDKINAACNILNAFIKQMSAKINSGRLSSADGQPLIDSASNVNGCN